MTITRTDPVSRFWAKVNKDGPVPLHSPELGPCWLWTGGRRKKNGYGRIKLAGPRRDIAVHRYAFFLYHGHWPNLACHRCDNKICCRDTHIYDGTAKSNFEDARARNRLRPKRKLKPEDIPVIRRRRAQGELLAAIAKDFNVSWITIQAVCACRNWKGIPDAGTAD